MTLWLDVEDLFHYAVHSRRPSGIQRLSFEIYAELHAMIGDEVRFCRHDPAGGTLRTVPWEAVQALFAGLLAPAPQAPCAAEAALPEPVAPGPPRQEARPGPLRRMVRRLPLEMRHSLARAVAAQRDALSHGAQAFRAPRAAPVRHGSPDPHRASHGAAPLPEAPGQVAAQGTDIRTAARPGDVLCVLGSPWFHSGYAAFIGGVTEGRSMRVALLVYDLIPLMRPEWCDSGLVRVFGQWFTDFAPSADLVFAISAASARDVERWAARSGTRVARPVRVLPIGTGFSNPPADAAASLPAGLLPGSYVLFVSTIEARKNHLLAFRVWRRLVEELPAARVPTLVFAGRVGWLVADLLQQLKNCSYLDGKIVIVADPTDAELVALYRGCRFTLFPSLYEGWGLPVSESLSFGKVCVASDRTSVPEAGGPFCRYLDPENFSAATAVIRDACTDDAMIAACEARIRAEFKPTPWRATAAALLGHLRGG